MVSIPVFTGKEKEDPERFLRQFQRACMANGDRSEQSWLELLPIHFDDTASFWYDRQTQLTRSTWLSLTKALISEFQEKESYQTLLGTLSLMRQHNEETVRQFSERVREIQSRIQRSLRGTSSFHNVLNSSEEDRTSASISSIDALALRSFIGGLKPAVQEIVAWKEPSTFEAALALAQKKEANLVSISQPQIITAASTPAVTRLVQNTPVVAQTVSGISVKDNDISQLVSEMRDLKLFLIQGQSSSRPKNQVADNRPVLNTNKSVQFITCHNCGRKGHYRSDCPDLEKIPTIPSGKLAEVNLLQVVPSSRVRELEPELMMAKRGRPSKESEAREKHRDKRFRADGRESTRKPRRKIGIEDLLLSRGQSEYSIMQDLGKQTANITVGQLVARCPSLRRELRQGINTRRRKPIAEVNVAEKASGDLRSPQVEATINGCEVGGCLIDGGAAINVISSWFMNEAGLEPNKFSTIRLKVADQRCVRSLGQINQIPVTVNGVTVKLDFHVLDISSGKGGYPMILGRPWLRQVRAVNYWDKGKMKIGTSLNRVSIRVIPESSSDSVETNSSEDYSSSEGQSEESSWDSEPEDNSSVESDISEAELYAIDVLPQVVSDSMQFIDDQDIDQTKQNELLSKVKFGPTLTIQEKAELEGLVLEYSDLFVTRHCDLPAITVDEHRIELTEDARPVRSRQKRMAPEKMSVLRAELDRLLEGGFITEVKNTEWVSLVVIVPKKGGKWRVCVNYKALNKFTKKDRQPLPHIDELLDEVAGHQMFTFCDGYAGYHQVKVHKDSILYTTFTTPWGTYAYLRMPFGLCNAGGTFQRVQLKIFGPYIGQFIRVYLDDFAVYGDRISHVIQVKAAFQKLREHGCSLSPEKCKIGFEEGPLLGHIVFNGGMRVDPDKVKRITEMSRPVSREQVAKLWGTTIYHNRFIPNLAGIGRPISALTSKAVPFVWSDQCEQAFSYIKERLASDPVVRNPVWDKQFIINPSTTEYAVAAVLLQNDEVGRAHPIYYASRLLTLCEQKYTPLEKLGVALLFACTKFKHYILSSNQSTLVQSDVEGLKQILQQKDPEGRIARLMAALQSYDLEVKTAKGARASHAGLLLELGTPTHEDIGVLSDDAECFVLTVDSEPDIFGYKEIAMYLKTLSFPEGINSKQRQKIRRQSKSYSLVGEDLYKIGKDGILRRAVTVEESRRVLEQCHEGLCGGHFATETTVRKILQAGLFWPNIFRDSNEYCRNCYQCQAYGKRVVPYTELQPIYPTGVFEKWGVDFVGPLPVTAKRNEYLIVATDYLSKWAEAAPVKNCNQKTAADFIYNQVICRYGCPLEIVTDRGSHFVNELLSTLMRKLSVKHRRASPYYPQANGLVEKTNGIIIGIIGKVVLEKRREWDLHVSEALWAYRTAHKNATGFTPFQLAFGLEATVPIELELCSLRTAIKHGMDEAESLKTRVFMLEKLDETRRQALFNYETLQNRRKAKHDTAKKTIKFSRGDLILRVDSWLAKQHGQKFKPRWLGPYVIHKRYSNGSYQLSTPDGEIMSKIFNGSKLKLYRHRDDHMQS